MNDTNDERNEQLVKVMSVIGFVVLVCLLAWLAVQVVRFIPVAFSSLANIFEENQRAYTEGAHDENENVVVINDEDTNSDEDSSIENSSDEDIDSTDEEDKDEPVVSNETSTNTTPTPTPVQYKTITTYKKPVSDPNGTVDLAASFVGVGYLNSTGRFVVGELPEDGQGAMQFVVKNNGTKTSNVWSFSAQLPNGTNLNNKVQNPLEPKESSTLTLVFTMDDERPYDVKVDVSTSGDTVLSNNGFNAKLVQR